MHSSNSGRKAKISLSDYPYRQDIENRILMAQLSVIEVDVLQEIIHHSLTISIEQFAKELDISMNSLISILDKLGKTNLFKLQKGTLIVDKDKRKYFEFQLEKFDENFEPNLDFLQNVLNNVPIHLLPMWYSLPRFSDNIFESIVEKYFSTPKTYLQYLEELQFDDPVLKEIILDVYSSPHLKVTAAEIRSKYGLSREKFEENLLLLEYHFACVLSYNKIDDCWQEVVTPFSELREYLEFELRRRAYPLQNVIEDSYFTDYNFIHDLSTVLKACQTTKISPQEVKNIKARTPKLKERVFSKLLQVHFVKQNEDGQIIATEKGKAWSAKHHTEQVATLSSDTQNKISHVENFTDLWNVRNLHLIEKTLRRLETNEWIEMDHFLTGFIAPIGDKENVALKNKGKKWKYLLPTYNQHEKHFIEAVIMERLAEFGVVSIGSLEGKPCFCLTPFGNRFIH